MHDMSFLNIMQKVYSKETATVPKSLKDAQKVLAAVGIKIKYDRDTNEYTINYMKNPTEATAYFTDDLKDAIGTGLMMGKKKEKASYATVIGKVLKK